MHLPSHAGLRPKSNVPKAARCPEVKEFNTYSSSLRYKKNTHVLVASSPKIGLDRSETNGSAD